MKNQVPGPAFDLTTANGAVELEAYVQCRLSGRLRGFRVVVTDKGLMPQGQASTYHAKQLAQHAVMEATTFPVVVNEIEVA
jgi:hypothetical protein